MSCLLNFSDLFNSKNSIKPENSNSSRLTPASDVLLLSQLTHCSPDCVDTLFLNCALVITRDRAE